MAQRAQPIALRLAAGAAALAVVALVFGTLAAVALRAESGARLISADWAAARFTVFQAALSALISAALAVPVARALSRRRFFGRRALILALGAPFILPVIVAVFGLLAVFGRNGLLNLALETLGTPVVDELGRQGILLAGHVFQLPLFDLYGIQGVLLAHVFFNLPLATRLLLQGWQRIPAESFRLAASLSLNDRQQFRVIELPMLRATLPGVLVVVFLLCLTSFAVVLTLGGGPRATTIELAIYQAFRFDFDLGRAALLALIQVGIGLGAALLALAVGQRAAGQGLDRVVLRWDGRGWRRYTDALLLLLTALFIGLPLAMTAIRGWAGLSGLSVGLWAAVLRSVLVALGATALTLLLALPLALRIGAASARPGARLVEALGTLSIAASPLVLGTGLFLILNPFLDPMAWALPLTAVVNALMALPFALRALVPAATEAQRRFDRLSESLNLPAGTRLRHVLLPRLRAPLGFALGLTAALSAGDLGVVALFADPNRATLPMEMYRLMGAYRNDEAAAAALLLVALAFGLFWVFERIGRHADT
ncbi:thiamine/thiamine pyrophosphate ABC transporter permease ThiP [Frigidibacter sp. ROC022]|uniref:thiamine/thiamine pyrophosphate ABC transporter permease ThiP n=1 Tax=Frigidibacter sp. ROC022 TaxID=2971796 RepID=UPI00215B609B|nr:thiamine/thiamine pyrophosphate ABC transporter permease ThiP [Frigidibacter sp. ROC022]MCR8724756.1 thiamine/thiamine pyrophosphate ABC transporter permease ThiP [Frigidibacter sp. ROC022]